VIMIITLPQMPEPPTGIFFDEHLPASSVRQGFERPDDTSQRRGGACPALYT
jgi:hypothetical protein